MPGIKEQFEAMANDDERGQRLALREMERIEAAPPQFLRFYDSVDKKTWIINVHQIGMLLIDATHGRESVVVQYGAAQLKFVGESAKELIRQLGVEPDSMVKM
jgi:hypothetical protein